MEAASALAVEAEVLREGLRNAKLEALLDEVADCPGVFGQVAGGEPLVRAVKEWEQVLLADGAGDLLPLLLCRVDACGVMSARVQERDGALGGGGESCKHAVEVEALGGWREVWVSLYGEADVGEDLVVVGPCWRGEVDWLVRRAWVEFGEKSAAEVDGSCAGDGLKGDSL